MTTMMEHPKHGRHPATGAEVEQLKAAGWTVRAPKTAAAGPDAAPEPVLEVLAEEMATIPARTKRAYSRKA